MCCKFASHLGFPRIHPFPPRLVARRRRRSPTRPDPSRRRRAPTDPKRSSAHVVAAPTHRRRRRRLARPHRPNEEKETHVRDARARRRPRVRVRVVVVILLCPRARRVEPPRHRPRRASVRDSSSRAREIRRAVEAKDVVAFERRDSRARATSETRTGRGRGATVRSSTKRRLCAFSTRRDSTG